MTDHGQPGCATASTRPLSSSTRSNESGNEVSHGLRELLANERHAVLATVSASRDGWPFASVAPYALSAGGEPLLLLSDLAEHTRNVRADPRASLFVQDSACLADPQAGCRVTILGQVKSVADAELPVAR